MGDFFRYRAIQKDLLYKKITEVYPIPETTLPLAYFKKKFKNLRLLPDSLEIQNIFLEIFLRIFYRSLWGTQGRSPKKIPVNFSAHYGGVYHGEFSY